MPLGSRIKTELAVSSAIEFSSTPYKMQLRNHLLFPVAVVVMYIAPMRTIDAVAREESIETERIVRGKPAREGQFPYACALFNDGSFTCTCSIIGERTVLTAAHCVVQNGRTTPVNSFHAIANVNKRQSEVRIDFESVTPHPNYTEAGVLNDIAVLKANQSIPFSSTVGPVCIARSNTTLMEYNNGTAMGYGDTTGLRVMDSDNLMYVAQSIRKNEECSPYYAGAKIDDGKMCGGGVRNGICNGDSGGPLVHLSADKPDVQIGIASYGTSYTPCGLLTPDVWCRVSFYVDFIKSVLPEDPTICEV